MSTIPLKPFLITKDEQGHVRLTVRETRYNSQGYPWIVKTAVEDVFTSTSAARAHATEQFGAKPGEFATK